MSTFIERHPSLKEFHCRCRCKEARICFHLEDVGASQLDKARVKEAIDFLIENRWMLSSKDNLEDLKDDLGLNDD